MSWLFDGEQEFNLKLERGESFGLSKAMYGSLAHIAMGARRIAGVEPCEIRLLADEPGCDVILYGRNYVYTIRMQPLKERSSLFGLPLDSKLEGPGVEMYVHHFLGSDFVGDIFATILQHEGVDVMTLGEYLGQQDVD